MLALIVPLCSLTTHRVSQLGQAAKVTSEAPAAVHLTISSTKVPFHYEVSHLGKIVWQGNSNDFEAQTELALIFPKEGIDLLVDVTWDFPDPAAVKLDVTPDGIETKTQTLWGKGSVSDVLTFN